MPLCIVDNACLLRGFFSGLQEKNALALWLTLCRNLICGNALDARIAENFGLRSFEVLGFGRATRFDSAMPVLTSAFLGAECVGQQPKSSLVLGLVQPFGVATILSKRAPVEFWRQRRDSIST